jgi:hypothetical protein
MSVATGAFLVPIGVLVFTDSLQAPANVTFASDVQTSRDEGVVQFWRWLMRGGC